MFGRIDAMLLILITLSDLMLYNCDATDAYQGYYDFAIGVRLEWVWLGQLLSENLVVVDLAIDGQSDGPIFAQKGLCSAVCVDSV